MKAVNRPSYDTKRTNLWDVIPLSGPYSYYLEPTRMCNLKCFYCIHATRGIAGGLLEQQGIPLKHMDMDLYDKIVNDILEFPEQPKRITFSGLGEPTMNPRLGEMARKLRSAGYTERIDVITNALLLTPELSDELVNSGISRIMISVQGLTSEKYKEIAGVAVDIEKYVENIRYLYEHKKDTQVYIKIIDANLKDDNEREEFFRMFGNICDTISVEHLIVLEKQTKDTLDDVVDKSLNFSGEEVEYRDVCAKLFYFTQINIEGNTYPCGIPGMPPKFSLGNVKEDSLVNIWNGKAHNRLMLSTLRDGYKAFCGDCEIVTCMNVPEENLDPHAEELLKRLENLNV